MPQRNVMMILDFGEKTQAMQDIFITFWPGHGTSSTGPDSVQSRQGTTGTSLAECALCSLGNIPSLGHDPAADNDHAGCGVGQSISSTNFPHLTRALDLCCCRSHNSLFLRTAHNLPRRHIQSRHSSTLRSYHDLMEASVRGTSIAAQLSGLTGSR